MDYLSYNLKRRITKYTKEHKGHDFVHFVVGCVLCVPVCNRTLFEKNPSLPIGQLFSNSGISIYMFGKSRNFMTSPYHYSDHRSVSHPSPEGEGCGVFNKNNSDGMR